MEIVSVHSKTELEKYLLPNRPVHVFQIGDLDDFFGPFTQWFAGKEGEEISALVLLYTALEIPILIAMDNHNTAGMVALLAGISHLLPSRCYTLISLELIERLRQAYTIASQGEHYIMAQKDMHTVRQTDPGPYPILPVDKSDQRALQDLLQSVDAISLTVKAANRSARRVYEKLGFEVVASYHECMLSRTAFSPGPVSTIPKPA